MEVIPLKYGSVFKRVFSNPVVFQEFAEAVLGIPLVFKQVHTEYQYPEPVGFVRSTYDLFAEDETHRIIVEIQHVKEEDFFERFLYYHMVSLVEQVRNYQAYWFERTVYTIVVLTSTPQDGSIRFSCAVSDFSPIDEWGQRVPLFPHRLVFLAPRLANAATPPKLRKWLEFITDSLDGEMSESQYPEALFQEMMMAIRRQTISAEELAEVIDESAWEKAKARFEAEGRAEGRAEGERTAKIAMIKAMLENGMSLEQVAHISGWDVQAIQDVC